MISTILIPGFCEKLNKFDPDIIQQTPPYVEVSPNGRAHDTLKTFQIPNLSQLCYPEVNTHLIQRPSDNTNQVK